MSKVESGTVISIKPPVWDEDEQEFRHEPPETQDESGYSDLSYFHMNDFDSNE